MDPVSKILNQFKILDRAIIDTSSLIYLSKTDLLDETAKTLQLMTVKGVVKEIGPLFYLKNIEIINLEKKKDTVNADRQVVEAAKHLKIPVISEDKKVLMSAKKANLPYFNSLMILNFLIYKGVILEETEENFFKALKSVILQQ